MHPKAIGEGFAQHIEPEKVDRLAQFYGVPVTDFLDEFNHFLYDGHPGPLLAGMGEWQKGYQHKMLGTALQRQGIEKAGNRLD